MVEAVAVLTTFGIGILASANPCALPLVPGYVGYLSSRSGGLRGNEKSLVGILIVMGVLSGMIVFATLAALTRTSIGSLLTIATPFVVGLLIAFGSLLILNYNPFYRLPYVRVPRLNNHKVEAFAYGGLYGVIALPCSYSIVLPGLIFASLSAAAALDAFFLFLALGLGLGLPVMVVSLLSRAQGDWLVRQIAKRSREMNVFAGVLLIGVAIYDLLVVVPLLRIYLPT